MSDTMNGVSIIDGELDVGRALAKTVFRMFALQDSQQRSDLQMADKIQELMSKCANLSMAVEAQESITTMLKEVLPPGYYRFGGIVESVEDLSDDYSQLILEVAALRAQLAKAESFVSYRVGEELTGENGERLFVVRPLPDRYNGALTIGDAESEHYLSLLETERVALIAGGYCAELPVEKSEPEKPVK